MLDVDAVSRLRVYALAHGDHNGDRSVDLDDTRMVTWLLVTLGARKRVDTPQKYCMDNYLACTHNEPAQRADYQNGPANPLEPGPDYYAPTGHYPSGGRGHGGPDHVNW